MAKLKNIHPGEILLEEFLHTGAGLCPVAIRY